MDADRFHFRALLNRELPYTNEIVEKEEKMQGRKARCLKAPRRTAAFCSPSANNKKLSRAASLSNRYARPRELQGLMMCCYSNGGK